MASMGVRKMDHRDAAPMRKAKQSSQTKTRVVLGWTLTYTLRPPGACSRGDLLIVDPRDEQKIFSVISFKRKLGLEEAAFADIKPNEPVPPRDST